MLFRSESIHRGMSPTGLLPVDYRPEGERRRGRKAWVAPWRGGTLRDDLEDVLGELVHYACELHPATSPSNPQQEVTMPLPTAAAEQRVSAPLRGRIARQILHRIGGTGGEKPGAYGAGWRGIIWR